MLRHSLRLRECWRWKRNNAIAARRVVRYNNFVVLLYIFTIVILKTHVTACNAYDFNETLRSRLSMPRNKIASKSNACDACARGS